jgi:hypothetical protein
VLFQLGFQDLQLTLGLVEVELEGLELRCGRLELGRELLLTFVGCLVGGQLGKGLSFFEETIDLRIEILDVEKIGEAHYLHAAPEGSDESPPSFRVEIGEIDHSPTHDVGNHRHQGDHARALGSDVARVDDGKTEVERVHRSMV